MSETSTIWQFERIRRIAVSLILFPYLTIAVIAASPFSSFHDLCDRLFKAPVNYLGLYNSYGVFAPDPAFYDQVFRAVITFQDGSKEEWIFPYLTQWKNDDVTRQFKLAWEEWQYYFMWSKDNFVLVTDAAKYVAWLHRNPSNQPVQVAIYRDYTEIIPPAVEGEKMPALPVSTEHLTDYAVSPEDLQ